MFGNPQNGTKSIQLDSIEEAIGEIRAGKIVIVVDDEDRENEGDFICAAECITPEIINFMATHGRGLICTPIDEKRADELELSMMVQKNTALHETAFTVSIDLIGYGCTTGISAYDRATGIKALIDPRIKASDFARPGHIFPLRAKSGGVLRRTGHTEAAIDLARLAGFSPAGVLVEILNPDGSMARLPQLLGIAKQHQLKIISIKDLVAYRMQTERLIRRELFIPIENDLGKWHLAAYTQTTGGDIHLALKMGTWDINEPVPVRVYSSTDTRNILSNLLEDNSRYIRLALEMIAKEGKGLFVFMRHNEKDDDLLSYLQNYPNQFEEPQNVGNSEQRDFGVGAQIIRDMGVQKIRLITNQPKRRVGLIGYGLEIVDVLELR